MVTRVLILAALTALNASGALLGARPVRPPQASAIDYDTTTVIEIETEADGDEFGFINIVVQSVDEGFDNPSMTIDWGDGVVEHFESFVETSSLINYYCNSSSTATHTYSIKGRYTVLVSGNVSGVTPLTVSRSWYMLKSYSAKRSNLAKHSSLTPISTLTMLWRRPVGMNVLDTSRVHGLDGYGVVQVLLSGGESRPFDAGPVEYRIPKAKYLSVSFLAYNTHVEKVVVANTMDDMFNMPASSSGTEKWNFSNGHLQPQVVIVCTDGIIKWVDGAWTRFPK